MRKSFDKQRRFGCPAIAEISLNLNCRDEIIPVLAGLQQIYSQADLRSRILDLVEADVNRDSRNDVGREGLSYWQIFVLAVVRLGCNLDYDRLQDLAEQHRTLRMMLGLGDWDDRTDFGWRRIRDNLCLLTPETIARISELVVTEGHRLAPAAAHETRADSFVVETNIHYPSESSLICDGIRKVIALCVRFAECRDDIRGWRQHAHVFSRIKRTARRVGRIASRKGARYQERLKADYQVLLKLAQKIIARARELWGQLYAENGGESSALVDLMTFITRTEHVMGTARRRVLNGESVPNAEKLFSIFEPHTQLYKRGKAGKPVQFGRQFLVYEDGAGFVTHSHLLPRDASDRDVLVEQTRLVQERLGGAIRRASFDRGFHSPENQAALATLIKHPCLPKPGAKQSAAQQAQATLQFRQARQKHPGVESAISALQSGNGLQRCRDRSEVGFERYLALGILGRNVQVLGRLVIARRDALAEAAHSRRRGLCAA